MSVNDITGPPVSSLAFFPHTPHSSLSELFRVLWGHHRPCHTLLLLSIPSRWPVKCFHVALTWWALHSSLLCVCVCMHLCGYVCLCMCGFMCICMCSHVYLHCVFMCVCMRVHACLCKCICICLCVCACVCMYAHIHACYYPPILFKCLLIHGNSPPPPGRISPFLLYLFNRTVNIVGIICPCVSSHKLWVPKAQRLCFLVLEGCPYPSTGLGTNMPESIYEC